MASLALFWISVLLIGYSQIGYTALIHAWAAGRRRGDDDRDERVPKVSILVVAHNEAARIEGRIENLLALDYPRDRLEIVVGSDGSNDDTASRARGFAAAGVRVLAFHRRRGKTSVLNDLVPRCRGEIVVLADARQRFEPDAVRALVRRFADRTVGAVGGELILADSAGSTVGRGLGLYWRFEKSIRLSESRVDSTVGATGAIYAIRRDLFDPIPDDTILDDVLIPMRIVRLGYRVVFEPAARAHDRPAAAAREEFVRKVRTIAGNFQMFARERWMLNPLRNRLWLQTVSHKGLRLLGPLLLTTALVSNVCLAGRPFYDWTLLLQGVFYASALVGHLERAARRLPVVAVPYTLCLLNWATVVAFLHVLTGRQSVTWERAGRTFT